MKCLYRPFDWRACYSSTATMAPPRRELLDHVALKENLSLNTMRQTKMLSWQHAIVLDSPAPAVYVEVKDGSNLFPLYPYPMGLDRARGQSELEVRLTHWLAGKDGRRPNLNSEFVADLEKRLRMTFVPEGNGDVAAGFTASQQNADLKGGATTFWPEDVFNHIYAIFHSPTYRSRYAGFLKSDFPRVPLTSDVSLFRALCGLGSELVALHLLESPMLENPIACYPVEGSNLVDKGFPKYVAPGKPEPGTGKPLQESRVYINRCCTYERKPLLADDVIHDNFKRFAQGVFVGRYALMPDHIHLFEAFTPASAALSPWMKSLKIACRKRCVRLVRIHRIGKRTSSMTCSGLPNPAPGSGIMSG